MPSRRRFHLDLPSVTTVAGDHSLTFVGATFPSRSIMTEYDVVPAVNRRSTPFGPLLIGLVVTDDVDADPYPASWEDFGCRSSSRDG